MLNFKPFPPKIPSTVFSPLFAFAVKVEKFQGRERVVFNLFRPSPSPPISNLTAWGRRNIHTDTAEGFFSLLKVSRLRAIWKWAELCGKSGMCSVCLTWMTFPYWMTEPMHFFVSVSFCFFSTSAACWKINKINKWKGNRFRNSSDWASFLWDSVYVGQERHKKCLRNYTRVFLSLRSAGRSVGYQLQLFSHPLFCLVARKEQKKSRWPNRAGKKILLGYLFPIDKPISSFPYFFSYMFEQTANRKGSKVLFIYSRRALRWDISILKSLTAVQMVLTFLFEKIVQMNR